MFKEGSKIAGSIIAAIVLLGLIAIGIWGFNVLTSAPKGAGDQEMHNNSEQNRTYQQQHFWSLYNEVIAADTNLDQAAKDKAENPGDDFFATNYSGLVKHCVDTRGQYNADANGILAKDWIDPQLPHQLTDADPKTDCKESKA